MPSPVSAEIATDPGWRVDEPLGLVGGEVGLVEHEQLGHVVGADLGEHRAHRVDLGLGSARDASTTWTSRSASADHLERRLERLDQLVGQLAHEADGVGQQHRLAAGQRQPAGASGRGWRTAGPRPARRRR